MKKKSAKKSAFFNLRALLGFVLCFAGVALAFFAFSKASAQQDPKSGKMNMPLQPMFRGLSPVVHFDISPALRDMTPLPAGTGKLRENEDRDIVPRLKGIVKPDPVVQSTVGRGPAIPGPIVSFDGPSNTAGVSPPDPNGDVGPNHVVMMSNLSFQIFNKAGTSLFGPASNNTLWSGFGGPCQTENSGDPVVLYDQLADRWLLSQFTSAGPTFFNCVAVSTTSDPTGTYYRYAISTGGNFPDYPKYSIWPDAYYISTREFLGAAGAFQGVGAYALNRAQILAGNPSPQVISFLAPPVGAGANVGDGLLPVDLDGMNLPPPGSPAYYVGSMDDNGPYGATMDALTLWKFVVNFANPPASSFALANTIPVASFNSILALCGGSRACIPQSGTANKIDHLGYRQRPLHRAAYRNFGGFESIVTNQSVSAGAGPGGEVSGIRWWELRSPNSSPVIFQEGTYAPGLTDGTHRWMGSLAEDNQGNMALGYSASDATIFPSVRYSGRLVSDPLGTMPQGESATIAGTGSQTGSNRWGDYTSTTVDPTDDCTFWYVNEYVPVTSSVGWRLRAGSFKFAQCTAPSKGTGHFAVTVCAGGNLANAVISIDGSVYGVSAANGTFDAPLAPGAHTYSITKNTFTTASGNFNITDGNTTNVAVCLTGAPAMAAGASALQVEGCSPNNNAIDPGETVTVSFCVQNVGGANTTNLVGTLQSSGGVTSPSGPQNYGVVVAGGASVCRSFTFTANGTCGGTITASLQLQDGASNLGTVTYTLALGALGTQTFSNPGTITINDNTSATPYPSTISVAGVSSYSRVTVTLNNVSHTFPDDIDIILVAPGGQKAYVMSDVGGGGDIVNVTLTFDDTAAAMLSDAGQIVAGTYKPSNVDTTTDVFPAPAPVAPYSADFTVFNGLGAGVNGTWSLFVRDDAGVDVGSISGGWSLSFVNPPLCSTACMAPSVVSAVSRKTHGGAGDFDVSLPLGSPAGIECRSGGATNDYQMVVTFGGAVSVTGSPQAQVAVGPGTVGSGGVSNGGVVSVVGGTVTIPLTNVANAQTIIVTLNGVTDGSNTGNVAIPMSRLLGDTSGNGTVNSSDVSQTKAQLGLAITPGNFRSDINLSGTFTSADVSLVKAANGTSVP